MASLSITAVTGSTSRSPKASMRCAMPTSLPCIPSAREDVEHGLALDAQAWDEVAAHTVGRGRCAREHRAEAGDRPCRVDSAHVCHVEPVGAQPVDVRGPRLEQAVGAATIDNNDDDPPRAARARRGHVSKRRRLRESPAPSVKNHWWSSSALAPTRTPSPPRRTRLCPHRAPNRTRTGRRAAAPSAPVPGSCRWSGPGFRLPAGRSGSRCSTECRSGGGSRPSPRARR